MLISLKKEHLIDTLKSRPVENCGEIIEIQQGGIRFYSDSTDNILVNRMVEYKFHDKTSYEIISTDEIFIDESLFVIRQHHDEAFSLYVNSHYSFKTDLFKDYVIQKSGTSSNYILPQNYQPDGFFNPNVIEVKNTDIVSVKDFHCGEILAGRPSFQTLFRVIVLDKKLPGGKIFAYMKNGQIIAYLSCYIFLNNIYDIDYIYVLPAFRKQGIGFQLANYYINTISAAGCLPRYGNAENLSSRKTAEKAGFYQVKSQDKYEFRKG